MELRKLPLGYHAARMRWDYRRSPNVDPLLALLDYADSITNPSRGNSAAVVRTLTDTLDVKDLRPNNGRFVSIDGIWLYQRKQSETMVATTGGLIFRGERYSGIELMAQEDADVELELMHLRDDLLRTTRGLRKASFCIGSARSRPASDSQDDLF